MLQIQTFDNQSELIMKSAPLLNNSSAAFTNLVSILSQSKDVAKGLVARFEYSE